MKSKVVLVLLVLGFRFLSAQDFSTPPIFNYACQIDSNCALYSKLGITMQVDSQFEKGKFYLVTTSKYTTNGQVFIKEEKYAELAAYRFLSEYQYDSTGKCICGRMSSIRDNDTVLKITKRMIVDDTATGYYSYEVLNWTSTAFPRDSVFDVLDTRYVSSTINWGTTQWHPNRILIQATSKGHGQASTGTLRVLHNEDTLYLIDTHDEGVGSLTYWNVMAFPDAQTKVYSMYYGSRYAETFTWHEGKLTEHHTYVDSLRGRDVVLTRINNLLDTSANPEITIYRYDSITTVVKGGVQVYVDYTPDSCRIDQPMPKPVPEFPTHDYYSTFRMQTKLNDGGMRIDFYNPYQGTALPLYRLWHDKDGVVFRMEEFETTVKRTTYKQD